MGFNSGFKGLIQPQGLEKSKQIKTNIEFCKFHTFQISHTKFKLLRLCKKRFIFNVVF